jgi:cyclohexanone monooxygenase
VVFFCISLPSTRAADPVLFSPGAACDSEAYCYLPLLEETGFMPASKYTRAPEILEHCRRIGTKWKLYDRALLQTECIEVKWDEPSARWICKTDRGDLLKAQFVIAASGPLHKPKLPGVPGLEKHTGHVFHSSRWDYKYTHGDGYGNLTGLKDKRVAIIGRVDAFLGPFVRFHADIRSFDSQNGSYGS